MKKPIKQIFLFALLLTISSSSLNAWWPSWPVWLTDLENVGNSVIDYASQHKIATGTILGTVLMWNFWRSKSEQNVCEQTTRKFVNEQYSEALKSVIARKKVDKKIPLNGFLDLPPLKTVLMCDFLCSKSEQNVFLDEQTVFKFIKAFNEQNPEALKSVITIENVDKKLPFEGFSDLTPLKYVIYWGGLLNPNVPEDATVCIHGPVYRMTKDILEKVLQKYKNLNEQELDAEYLSHAFRLHDELSPPALLQLAVEAGNVQSFQAVLDTGGDYYFKVLNRPNGWRINLSEVLNCPTSWWINWMVYECEELDNVQGKTVKERIEGAHTILNQLVNSRLVDEDPKHRAKIEKAYKTINLINDIITVDS